MNELEKTSRDLQDKIGKHTELKSKLELIRNPANANELATMKQQVEASLNELHKRQQEAFDELEQLKQKLASASSSKVVVHKYLYPNVKINISGAYYTATSTFVNLVVKNVAGEIQLYNEP